MDRLLREGNPPVGQLASPVPQYKRPGSTDYEPVEGQHGAPFATLKDASGNVVSPATDAKLEQVRQLLTGVATENKLEQARVLLDTISTKDFATSSNQDALKTVVDDLKSELLLVKSELEAIKANQLSGDQKVQLSGTIAEEIVMEHGSGGITHTLVDNPIILFYPGYSRTGPIASTGYSDRWVEGSKFRRKQIYIRNNYDGEVRVRLLDQTRNWWGVEIFALDVPAGADASLSGVDYPELNEPYRNLIFEARDINNSITSGNMLIRFRGWVR